MNAQAYSVLTPIGCCCEVGWVLNGSGILHWSWSFSKYSIHCLDAWIWKGVTQRGGEKMRGTIQTLTTIVRIAAITSRDPSRMQLLGKERSYSHITVAFSTAAIWVMWPMTAMLAMLTTWLKQLKKESRSHTPDLTNLQRKTHGSWFSSAFQSPYSLHAWNNSIVSHAILLFEVLSRVTVKS